MAVHTTARDRVFTSNATGTEYCVPGGRQITADEGKYLYVTNGPGSDPWVCEKVFVDGDMVFIHISRTGNPVAGFKKSDNFLVMDYMETTATDG